MAKLTDEELIELERLLKERDQYNASKDFIKFAAYLLPDYDFKNGFHSVYYRVLDLFAKGIVKRLIITVPPQHGKFLKHDTKVLTKDGFKWHIDLKPGDFVYNDKGKLVPVLWNSGGYQWQTLNVTFDNGIVIKAAPEHLWKVRTVKNGKLSNRKKMLNTSQIKKLIDKGIYVCCELDLKCASADVLRVMEEKKERNPLSDSKGSQFTPKQIRQFFIKSISENGIEYGNCIEVSGGMYLASESLIPTHNSTGSTKLLPSYILGTKPKTQIAVVSYSGTQARKFNLDIQRTIESQEYREIFPEIKLAKSKFNEEKQAGEIQTSAEFHISKYQGSLKAVGRGGALTGNPVDILILDDLYKDAAEGNSPIIRDSVEQFYISVADTRLHNDSQQLIVFTRWHEEDLIGWLEKKQKVITITDWEQLDNLPSDVWVKLNFEAIKESEPTEIDPRQLGDALFPQRHSKQKLMQSRALDPDNFNCMYQGNPISQKGKLYQNPFKVYDDLPPLLQIRNYTDTADTGKDYLCSINYGLPLNPMDKHVYILDVLFSNQPMEVTEPSTANMINLWGVSEADIESNSGGRSFARYIEQNTTCYVNAFYQSGNKESRIFSNSARVNDEIVFPSNWAVQWPEFYNNVTLFKKNIKANKNDDGPDVLTGIIETKSKVVDIEIEEYWD